VRRSFEWIIVTLNKPRAVVAALLLGFVALSVGADVPRAADGARGAVKELSAANAGDSGLEAGPGTNLQRDYSWDKTGSVQAATVWPADEPKGRLQTMMQFAPALLVLVLVALGLTITFTSLRKDMKQRRRIVYRPRGPRSTGGSEGSRPTGNVHEPSKSGETAAHTAR
jgi:uncharacterized membrane protein